VQVLRVIQEYFPDVRDKHNPSRLRWDTRVKSCCREAEKGLSVALSNAREYVHVLLGMRVTRVDVIPLAY
jgi:hypothetical protein